MKYEQPKDQKRQETVANKLSIAFSCEWGQMGPYSPFDVYLRRGKDMVAIVEIKTRNRERQAFKTTLLNLNKWFSLMLAEVGLQLSGLFVVAFTDGIWYVRIGHLPVSKFRISWRGREDRPEANNDVTPVIEIPIKYFKRVCDSDGVFNEDH